MNKLITVLACCLMAVFFSCRKTKIEKVFPAHSELDVAYGEHPLQKMDVYFPENYNAETPVVFIFHGGGFIEGSKEEYKGMSELFKAEDFIVVNCNYRLMDATGIHSNPVLHKVSEIKLYDALIDARAAVDKFKNMAAPWNAGTAKMFMTGHSAGAILSLLFLNDNKLNLQGDIRAAGNWAGTSDLTIPSAGYDDYLQGLAPNDAAYIKELAFRWTGKELDQKNALAFMAISAYWVTYNWIEIQKKTGRPVISVMPEFNDPFPISSPISTVRNVRNYHTFLDSKQVPNKLVMIPGENHGFAAKADSRINAVKATAAFFKQH